MTTTVLTDRDTLVFDLDNTLYPASSRLFDQVDVRMTKFVANLLGVPSTEARKIQKDYFHRFGTTLIGLIENHDVTPEEFLHYVHDIDLACVPHNARLLRFLSDYPGKKVVFTNGSADHADNILTHLQINDLFHGCFDIIDAGYIPKPDPTTYDKMLNKLNVDPKKSIMFEDIPRNLEPAANLGMATVWITGDPEYAKLTSHHGTPNEEFIHYTTDCITTWLETHIQPLQDRIMMSKSA